MERKSEINYQDPFDLLRNMNDVLYNYGEQIAPASMQIKDNNSNDKPQSTQNHVVNEDYIEQVSQANINKQNQLNNYGKLTRHANATYNTGKQQSTGGAVGYATKQSQNQLNSYGGSTFYSNNPNTYSNKKHLKSNIDGLGSTTLQNESIDNSFSDEKGETSSIDNSQFPDINAKNVSQYNLDEYSMSKNNYNFKKTARVRHILDKQKERILNTNIPEVNKMFDGLDHKYNRILKLKEEFQDIKSQFSMPNTLLNTQKKVSQQNASMNSSMFMQTQESNFKSTLPTKLTMQIENQDSTTDLNTTNPQQVHQQNLDYQSRTQSQPKQRLQRLIQKQQVQQSLQYQQSVAASKSFKINVFNHTSRSLEKDSLSQQRRDKALMNQRVKLALKSNGSIEYQNNMLTINKKQDLSSKMSEEQQIGDYPSSRMVNQNTFRKQMSLQEHSSTQSPTGKHQEATSRTIEQNSTTITSGRKYVKSQLYNNNSNSIKNYITLSQLKIDNINNQALVRLNKLYPHTRGLIEHLSPVNVNQNSRFKNSEQKQSQEQYQQIDEVDNQTNLNKDTQIESAQICFDEQTNRFNVLPQNYSDISMSRQHTQYTGSYQDQQVTSFDKRREKESFLKYIYGEDNSKIPSQRATINQSNTIEGSGNNKPVKDTQVKQIENQQHAGIALYEKFINEQQRQIKLIQKQQKKLKKQRLREENKRAQNSSVENIYLRETVGSAGRNLATSQGSGYFQSGNYFLHKRGSKNSSHQNKKSKQATRSVSQNSKRRSQSLGLRSQVILDRTDNKTADILLNQSQLANSNQQDINDISHQQIHVKLYDNTQVQKLDAESLNQITLNQIVKQTIYPEPANTDTTTLLQQNQNYIQDTFNNLTIHQPQYQSKSNYSQLQELKKKIDQLNKDGDQELLQNQTNINPNQQKQQSQLFKLSKYEEPKEDTQIEMLMMNSSIFQLSSNQNTARQTDIVDSSHLIEQNIKGGDTIIHSGQVELLH